MGEIADYSPSVTDDMTSDARTSVTVHGFHGDCRDIHEGKRRKAVVYMVHVGPIIFSELLKKLNCFDWKYLRVFLPFSVGI